MLRLGGFLFLVFLSLTRAGLAEGVSAVDVAGVDLAGADVAGVDVLADLGITVTSGAAPGYVPDAVCGECHVDKWESFQEVGMGKSFRKATGAPVIEDFDHPPFYHAPSKRYYQIWRSGEAYWFRRYQLNAEGARIHQFEAQIDWILGSGHHSRIYLLHHANGDLYQLPLSWYSFGGADGEGYWEMAPGYEAADHFGLGRQVRQRCMACHNGFPDVALGSDQEGMPQSFPADLPEGIGCQRCHGPGEAHLRLLYSGEGAPEDIRAAIVNPADLPAEDRYGICYGCHMQPSVAVTPELRLGRGAYSFRPGERLVDYKVFLDIEDGHRPQEARFDINHHPYRMEQSACFLETQGQDNALGCLTCHDPHVKRPVAERAAHYRAACLSCHEVEDNGLPQLATGAPHPDVGPVGEAGIDCVQCHMPARRTQDVIHAVMTDHKIGVPQQSLSSLVAPMEKLPPDVVGITVRTQHPDFPADQAHLARIMGALRFSGYRHDEATTALVREVNRKDPGSHEPWLVLSRAMLAAGVSDQAKVAAERGLAHAPDNVLLRQQRALASFRLGDQQAGVDQLRAILADHPAFSISRFNLAVFLTAMGQLAEADVELSRLLDGNPNHWPGWRLRARIAEAEGRDQDAITAYLEALRVEPLATDVAAELAPLLEAAGVDPATYVPRD